MRAALITAGDAPWLQTVSGYSGNPGKGISHEADFHVPGLLLIYGKERRFISTSGSAMRMHRARSSRSKLGSKPSTKRWSRIDFCRFLLHLWCSKQQEVSNGWTVIFKTACSYPCTVALGNKADVKMPHTLNDPFNFPGSVFAQFR